VFGAVTGVLLLGLIGILGSSFVRTANEIDARLHGERTRTFPKVFARELEIRQGQTLSLLDLVGRLNDLGYTAHAAVVEPAEFVVEPTAVVLTPRTGDLKGESVRISFLIPPAQRGEKSLPAMPPAGVAAIEVIGQGPVESILLEPPLLSVIMTGEREKRRRVALSSIPLRMQQAVLAIEDQNFYLHPGVNPITTVGAVLTNIFGDKPYLVGGSTITQQLARNFFLSEELAVEQAARRRSYTRKASEWFISLVLEQRASKDEILELYLNDVYLGQRGSFAVHGVAQASRLFFGKDVSNLSLSEAALIAGVIQSPSSLSPFNHAKRAEERRNVVLRAMADVDFVSKDEAREALKEPLLVVTRGVDNEAPYFVDHVNGYLNAQFPNVTAQGLPVEVFTTLDLNLQRIALDAVRDGLANVDMALSRNKQKSDMAQAALIAIDPRTGEILAMVGGRSYNQSQFNRAVTSQRQPGSVFKPFVFLAALEYAAAEGLPELTPAALVVDEPTTFFFEDKEWSPANYGDKYSGPITWRTALSKSLNVATIRVGELAGFDRVAALWQKVGVGTPALGYPSIALGVFELSPFEVAKAYTLFTNQGQIRPLTPIRQINVGTKHIKPPTPVLTPVARADSTYLVTNMMRAVINEGTGAGARRNGFRLDAAGKTGTTNDLRDAWFAGFTPELLTVVWVGIDRNQPLGLTGAQAALPIWTSFMRQALAGHDDAHFAVPDGVSFADIDPDTGLLAQPGCPLIVTEAFLVGSEPIEACPLHTPGSATPALSPFPLPN
jgi:penicillin-binding protein 1B